MIHLPFRLFATASEISKGRLISISPIVSWRRVWRSFRRSRMPLVGLALAALGTPQTAQQIPATSQTPLQVVTAMVQNEKHAREHRTFFRYISVERSSRTDGHQWKENVAETPDGLLRRLVAEDGKPLAPDRAAAEDRRLAALIADPSSLRAADADRRADEARIVNLLDILPRAFLFATDGATGDCTRIAFRPNPAFAPATYDQRIVHGLAGVILIRMPSERLCGIEGHLIERVTFGFGLLGRIEKDSHFSVTREPVTTTDWKSTHIDVHLDGRILLLKSISREEDATHSSHQPLPPHLSLEQAAALTRS
jgi:hypothetical protein